LLIVVHKNEAKCFFVDPLNGSMANDGSREKPWSTLQAVFDSNKICSRKYETKPAVVTATLITKNAGAPVKAGDTLLCRKGNQGIVFASEYYNEDWITIMAAPGDTPSIASCELRSGCRWRLKGFVISPSFITPYKRTTLVTFTSHSWTGPSRECIVEECTGYSIPDASAWTKEQWDTLSCNALSLPGTGMIARRNMFRNVNFGINVSGDSCLVEYNTVENFAGDGMRGLGDYGVFQYNIVKNCYDVNENHDDGFQSWSVGDSGDVGTGVVYGIVLRGNTIINYEKADQPFRGALQGIGCFDGMFENWVVENNVVITDHWHGITLSGATNCRIVNNTVVDINDTTPGPPWIRISEHKDGRKSSGCVVRNNLTTSISCDTPGVVIDHNLIVTRYEDFFVGYETKNMHLRAGCTAIDAGINGGAPATDRDALSRPVGSSVDIGAYEYRASNICLSANRIVSQNQFAFERQGGTLMALLPLTGGTLSLFDLSGRRLETILCTGDQCVIPYRNRGLNRSLIAQYAVGDKKFVSCINAIE
jgi:hypothetical protein